MAGELLKNIRRFFYRQCRTPLHWACRRGHLVIIELLLRHGGDVTLLTHKGERPVDVACNDEVVKLLAPDGMLVSFPQGTGDML